MHPSREEETFLARDDRRRPREAGVRLSRRISKIFLKKGWFFPASDDDDRRKEDKVALFVSRFSQQQEEGHSEEEEEEEEHEDGALVRFASKASVRKRTRRSLMTTF